MIRLARNALGIYLYLNNGAERVNWTFMEKLDNLQKKLIFKFQNKFSSKYVHWQEDKMEVKYARQASSPSVAETIKFLQDIDRYNF